MIPRSAVVLAGAALAATLLLPGCAQVGRPPGGPVDDTPPVLEQAEPGSLAVKVSPSAELRLRFSEKVDRRSVARALRLVPDVELRKPRFEDFDVVFRPLRSWPADTVVVWTIDASLPDKHRVKMKESRSGAFTTGTRFPPAKIVGRAAVRDTARVRWESLRAQLNLPPEEGSRRPTLWREARGADRGRFVLPWLEPGSGPFDLRVFLDSNGDGRPGEKERIAERDSLRLSAADSVLDLGELLLLDRVSPVAIVFCLAEVDTLARRVWAAGVEAEDEASSGLVDSTGCVSLSLTPGEHRWGAWIDLDGDGKWGGDSTGTLEPRLLGTTFTVEAELPDSLQVDGVFESPDSLDATIPEALRSEQP